METIEKITDGIWVVSTHHWEGPVSSCNPWCHMMPLPGHARCFQTCARATCPAWPEPAHLCFSAWAQAFSFSLVACGLVLPQVSFTSAVKPSETHHHFLPERGEYLPHCISVIPIDLSLEGVSSQSYRPWALKTPGPYRRCSVNTWGINHWMKFLAKQAL